VMKKEPNRFRTLYLAAKATSALGETAAARRYAKELDALCPKADAPLRPELAEVRKLAR